MLKSQIVVQQTHIVNHACLGSIYWIIKVEHSLMQHTYGVTYNILFIQHH